VHTFPLNGLGIIYCVGNYNQNCYRYMVNLNKINMLYTYVHTWIGIGIFPIDKRKNLMYRLFTIFIIINYDDCSCQSIYQNIYNFISITYRVY